jgi:hypothetical protein
LGPALHLSVAPLQIGRHPMIPPCAGQSNFGLFNRHLPYGTGEAD